MKNSKQTTLDLNGPILSFTSNPVGVASTGVGIGSTGGGSATFTGIATATFNTIGIITNPASNTGYVTYRWYEVGVGALSDSTYITGTATTSLTISNLITPTDNRREFYLTADYVPSAYSQPLGSDVTAGTGRSTGNAILEPINSGIATVTVYPLLEIIAQPSSTSAILNGDVTFRVNAGLTDSYFPTDLAYQWYWDGIPVNDGTITTYETVNITTSTTTYQTINQIQYRTVTSSSQRSENRTFTSDGSVTLHPSSYDVIVRVASGKGGRGGDDATASGGAGGVGRFGRFFYQGGGRTLDFKIGRSGNDGASNQNSAGGGRGGSSSVASGGNGGNAGVSGSSGGGGGGGGATGVYDRSVGRYTIVAAGGAGGGGASFRLNGGAGAVGGGFGSGSISPTSQGNNGQQAIGSGDGGGGGGSGGGAIPVGAGGIPGADIDKGNVVAGGGAITFGTFDSSIATFPFDGTANDGDGYVNIEWKWTETTTTQEPYTETVTVPVVTTTTTTQTVPRNTTLSGTKTSALTVRSDAVGVNTVTCLVSSATAGNSPLLTEVVQFNSVSTATQSKVQVEIIGNTSTANTSLIDLFNGEFSFLLSSQNDVVYSFYSPDRDIVVEMDLYGGKGNNVGSYRGGEGGFSRIRFTMLRNAEHVIAGLIPSVNAPFVYRKGQLIACVGGGGNAGSSGNGGFGGGIGISGSSGSGRGNGAGGVVVQSGSLGVNGAFGSVYTQANPSALIYPEDLSIAGPPQPGLSIKCTKGVYWRDQGVSPCSDVGTTQFRLSDGTIVTNTGTINRGFKAGYNIIETAGAGFSNGGNGGNGVRGGFGGRDGAGGGGGSGYTDGSVSVISSTLGGSTGDARVILRRVN